MKKIAFLFFLFGTFFTRTRAQYPFPVSDALWEIQDVSTHRDASGKSISYNGKLFVSYSGEEEVWNGEKYYLFGEWPGGLSEEEDKVWITFNWEDEILLYDFGARTGDTIVHGPVYRDFPEIDPVHHLWELAEKDGYCFSIVRNVVSPYTKTRMDVDCFYVYVDPDTGKKESVFLGKDTWIKGVGSINGFFTSWVHLIPPEEGPGWIFTYRTSYMAYKGEKVYVYSGPIRYRGGPARSTKMTALYDDFSGNLHISKQWEGVVTVQLLDLSEKIIYETLTWESTTVTFDRFTGDYLCRVLYDGDLHSAYRVRLY